VGENLDVLGDWGCFCMLRFGGRLVGGIKRARSKADDFSPLPPIRFCTFYPFLALNFQKIQLSLSEFSLYYAVYLTFSCLRKSVKIGHFHLSFILICVEISLRLR
jgi:hypothetical protein